MSMQGLPVGPQPVQVGDEMVLYGDGRTKQAFKDQTDINKILMKAQAAGSIDHLTKHGAVYGDFSQVPDLLEAHELLRRGQKIYDDLPSELRKEFPNQFKFFEFVTDPEHSERLREVLPELSRPGRQLKSLRSARDAAQALKAANEQSIEDTNAPTDNPNGT